MKWRFLDPMELRTLILADRAFQSQRPKSQIGILDLGHHLEDVERVERVAVVLPAMDPRCNQEPTRGHYLTGESCL